MPDTSPGPFRTYSFLLSGALVFILAFAAMLNWAVDPMQVFRRSAWHAPLFSENQRYQSPGMARHYVQPIVVVGTSHMENMLPSMVRSTFGKPALNLSIAGSSLREQQLALSLALETGKVERVLWGIDYSALTWGDILVEEWGEFPEYLYNFDIRLISRYLLSSQTLMDGVSALRGETGVTLENRNTWWNKYTFNHDRVIGAWRQQGSELTPEFHREIESKLTWPTFDEVLKRRLFATVRAHPSVHFDLILPPYSILNYVNDFRLHDEYFFQRLLMRARLKAFASTQPNVTLWDFQTDVGTASNLDNYKDLEHYGLPINKQMLDRIAAKVHTNDSIDPFPTQIRAYLHQLCAQTDATSMELCPREVRCGLDHLDWWIEHGASEAQLLAAAHTPCHSSQLGE